MRIYHSLLVGLMCFYSAAFADQDTLRLATTTSTANSGLLDLLLPTFEATSGYAVKASAVGTGAALRMGRGGKVDALLVHAPTAEQKFIEAGHGLTRHQVMYNDFVLVGPPDDPAQIKGLDDVVQALVRISAERALFVSRADDSGTNKKELSLWREAGVDPYGADWYLETGSGMAATLELAGTRIGYTLTDRGTWLARRTQLSLRLLAVGDKRLHNPYAAIVVNPVKHPETNVDAAEAFVNWLLSSEAQGLIREFRVDGEQLFIPVLAEKSIPHP